MAADTTPLGEDSCLSNLPSRKVYSKFQNATEKCNDEGFAETMRSPLGAHQNINEHVDRIISAMCSVLKGTKENSVTHDATCLSFYYWVGGILWEKLGDTPFSTLMTLICLMLQSNGQSNCKDICTSNISKTFFDHKKLVYEYSQDYEEIQKQLKDSGNPGTEEYCKYLTNADLAYRIMSAHCRGLTSDNPAYCDEFRTKYSKYMDKDILQLKCTKVSQDASLRNDSSGGHAPAAAEERKDGDPVVETTSVTASEPTNESTGQKGDNPTQKYGKADGAEAKPTAPDNGDARLQTVSDNNREGKEAHANGKGDIFSQEGNPEQGSAYAVATSQDEQTGDTHQQSEIGTAGPTAELGSGSPSPLFTIIHPVSALVGLFAIAFLLYKYTPWFRRMRSYPRRIITTMGRNFDTLTENVSTVASTAYDSTETSTIEGSATNLTAHSTYVSTLYDERRRGGNNNGQQGINIGYQNM